MCVPLWSLGCQACAARSFRPSGQWAELCAGLEGNRGLWLWLPRTSHSNGDLNRTVSRQGLQRKVERGPVTLGVKWRPLSLRIHSVYQVGVNGVGLMTPALRKASDSGAAGPPGSQENCLRPASLPPLPRPLWETRPGG